MYPSNSWVSNELSSLQFSLLASECMAFKLHRRGVTIETVGKNNVIRNKYPSLILPRKRWRYQMANMHLDSEQRHSFGCSVTCWETGKNSSNMKKSFDYPMWRKHNYVFL